MEGVSSAARVADLGSRRKGARPLEDACVRLCRLAARLLDVPAALVALKDEDRPFLAGSIGLEASDPQSWWGATPLSIAVSDQVCAEPGALMVEDLAARELLAADPLHHEQGFRALLAIPLDPGPESFGSLCVLAREPRLWSERDVEVLEEIGESVVTEIQLRGSVRRIRSVEEATTRAARRSFIGLIDSIDAVVHERNLRDGGFTFVSRRARSLFGHPVERWVAEPDFWAEAIVHPGDRERARAAVADARSRAEPQTFEYRALTSEGRTLWIRDSLVRVPREGGTGVLRGVMIDVTRAKTAELELQRKNRLLGLLQELALLANERNLEDALRIALERICVHTGWPVGHLWVRAPSAASGEPPRLAPPGIWHAADEARFGAFCDATARIPPDRGLPGQVLRSGSTVWICPLCEASDFPRLADARAAGLTTAVGFPILSAGEVLAVVELLTPARVDPDETVLELAGHVGPLLGRVMERWRADAVRSAPEQRTLESLTEAFVGVDPDLRITFVNSAGERLLGGSTAELIGRPLAEVLPDGAEPALGACAAARESGEASELAVHLPARDRWIEIRISPSRAGLSLYLHDATDRRRVEEQVRESEARYRFLADSVPQQIWTADPAGRLDYVNRVVLDYTGRSFARTLEEGWEAVIHPADRARAQERWERAVARSRPFELEARLCNAAGEYRWHLCRARCQTSPEGVVLRWYGANTDIHDQKELEAARDRALDDLERVTHLLSSERTNLELQARELHRTARQLQKSNEDLDRFAYVASHDLKAPLRGIANLTEWLVEDLADKLTPETTEYATLLQNRVQRMEALIDGILQYSRAGRSREAPQLVDVGEIVRDAIQLLDPPERFEIRLGEFWPTIRTERTPLQQVFMNLIGNAVKHADGERPVIDVRMRDENEHLCEFSVSDNGPGIATEYHERIFTIFQTLHARDDVEGAGIGLSVVKRTVENQGGQVWVESDVGQGATFGFVWPRSADQEHPLA